MAPSRLQVRNCRWIVGEVRSLSDILVGGWVRSMDLHLGGDDSPQSRHGILTTSVGTRSYRIGRERRIEMTCQAGSLSLGRLGLAFALGFLRLTRVGRILRGTASRFVSA